MPEQPAGRRLYVNKDRTMVVPFGDPRAAVMMHEKDVKRLGIKIPSEKDEAPEPVATVETEDESEEKAMPPAANKARARGEDKWSK